MLFFNTTIDGLQMGLCFAVLALGVYISYSLLNFPDLSVDGTFPLGGIISTVLMLRLGFPPVIALIFSFIAGAVMGAITGVLHVKYKISELLSGIISMTALMSICLALTSLLSENGMTTTIYSYRKDNLAGLFGGKPIALFSGLGKDIAVLIALTLIVILVKIVIDLLLKTKLGYLIVATGNNDSFVKNLGKNPGKYKIIGLSVANGFSALSGGIYGSLFMQYDNTCGSGKVVLALASVIIGIAVFSKIKLFKNTTSVIFGAIVYSLCLNYLTLVDTNGIYLKLLNAVLFALILIFNEKIKRFSKKGVKNND